MHPGGHAKAGPEPGAVRLRLRFRGREAGLDRVQALGEPAARYLPSVHGAIAFGDGIATADLEGRQPDPARQLVDQLLLGEGRFRVAEASEAFCRRGVRVDEPGVVADRPVPVEVVHAHGGGDGHRGSVHAVGAVVGEDFGFLDKQAALRRGTDPHPERHVHARPRREEVLAAAEPDADVALQTVRELGADQVDRMRLLGAEGTAEGRGAELEALLPLRGPGLVALVDHAGRVHRRVHGHLSRFVGGQRRVGLHVRVLDGLDPEDALRPVRHTGRRGGEVALLRPVVEGDVVRMRIVDRGVESERRLRVEGCRQWLVLDLDQGQGRPQRIAVLGRQRGHVVAHEPRAVFHEDVLVRMIAVEEEVGQVGARERAKDPVHPQSPGDVDREHTGMRMGAAHDPDDRGSLARQVAHVGRPPAQLVAGSDADDHSPITDAITCWSWR